MSIIESSTKELLKSELNRDKNNNTENKTIIHAKELLKKLLQNTLNSQLLKLETNSLNQIASLKMTTKTFKEFSKIISNFSLNVEEVKKKKLKEKEKKSQAFKRGRKMITEYNINNRSKTIESHLLKFKNKIINIDGKKNIAKINKKPNMLGHKLGNKTMSSFRNINEIEKEQETNNQRMHRFKNISFQNTSQNFRKGNNKTTPVTPVIKLKEKEKNHILTKTNKSKNIDYRNGRSNHSRTVILSHLTDIDEKNENIEKNNNENQVVNANHKNVKRVIYKNENKNRAIRINYKTERVNNDIKNKVYNRNTHEYFNKNNIIKTADDINIDFNNSVNINSNRNSNKNINITETNELKSIVKLVDDVNENLNKLLKANQNQNKRRSSVKEIKMQHQSTNALITTIKDVKIKELQNNHLVISEHKRINEKNMNLENNGNGKNNISKSYSLNYAQMRENIINLKTKENNINELIQIIFKKNHKVKPEEKEQNKMKKNKSFTQLGNSLNLFDFNNDKIHSKTTKNIFEKQKLTSSKETKNNLLIKKMKMKTLPKNNFINNNNKNEKIKLINSIIKIILDKTDKKIEIIKNQKNKENQIINILNNKNESNNHSQEKQFKNNLIKDKNGLNITNACNKCESIKSSKIKLSKSKKDILNNKFIFSSAIKNKERKSKSLIKPKKINKFYKL